VKGIAYALADLADEIWHWVAARMRSQRWVWLIPVAVLCAMVRWPIGRIEHIMAAIVGLIVLAWAVRRPGPALIALVVFLPLQQTLFGFLYAAHVPSQILRPAGGLKELIAGGILLSAFHALHIGRVRQGKTRQLDAIDKALLVYVGVVTAYLLAPHLFSTFPVNNKLSVRLLAWRADCGYLLVFFAVRHAPIPDATRKLFVRVLMGMAALTVLVGLYQWSRPDSWTHLILVTGAQVKYQVAVLGNDHTTVIRNLGYLTNQNPLRVGSIFLGPFDMADFLLIAFAVSLERIARDFRSRASYATCAVILLMLFASRVRADALAAVVIALVAMVPTPNRPIGARLRLLGAILVAAAVVVPAIAGTRFVNAEGGGKSNGAHVTEIASGIDELIRNPLGIGIGNVAGVGDRFVLTTGKQGGFTVDNAVLQVGDELGFQALLPWLVLMVLVWRALGRAAKESDPFAGGVRLAFLALFVAGMYHHVFLGFPVAWTLWAAVALALKRVDAPRAPVRDEARGNIVAIEPVAFDGFR
jgi:hypothetical protein